MFNSFGLSSLWKTLINFSKLELVSKLLTLLYDSIFSIRVFDIKLVFDKPFLYGVANNPWILAFHTSFYYMQNSYVFSDIPEWHSSKLIKPGIV